MKAAVWHAKRDIRVEDVSPPTNIGPGEVLLTVSFCGICGTDLHEYLDGPQYITLTPHPVTGVAAPVILGHEISGTVAEVGDGVTSARRGDRVAVNPLQVCHECPACRRGMPALCDRLAAVGLQTRWGGMASQVIVKDYQLVPLPDSLSFEQGAVVEPAAVTVHAVARGGVQPGDVVLVTGGGPIGQLVAMAARAAGAGAVYLSEPSAGRRALAARTAEPTRILDPTAENIREAIRDLTNGAGADVALECSANERALHDAIASVRRGGTVVQTGVFTRTVTLNPSVLTNNEKSLVGTICYLPGDFEKTMAMMADGRMPADRVVTATIPLNHVVDQGFDELIRPDTSQAKILVRPAS